MYFCEGMLLDRSLGSGRSLAFEITGILIERFHVIPEGLPPLGLY
jgi:hypothetical protein